MTQSVSGVSILFAEGKRSLDADSSVSNKNYWERLFCETFSIFFFFEIFLVLDGFFS
jgi:hypothetical protein